MTIIIIIIKKSIIINYVPRHILPSHNISTHIFLGIIYSGWCHTYNVINLVNIIIIFIVGVNHLLDSAAYRYIMNEAFGVGKVTPLKR